MLIEFTDVENIKLNIFNVQFNCKQKLIYKTIATESVGMVALDSLSSQSGSVYTSQKTTKNLQLISEHVKFSLNTWFSHTCQG